MADWIGISGLVGSVAFGGLSLFQFIRDYGQGKLWQERERSLVAVKMGLMQMRAMLTEAGTLGEIIKTDGQQQFVRQLGHQVKTIEHHIDGMLGFDFKKILILQPDQNAPSPKAPVTAAPAR